MQIKSNRSMNNTVFDFFSTVINLSASFLSCKGFKRSGSSYDFCKISPDRKSGKIIAFRRSRYNTPDQMRFCILCSLATDKDLSINCKYAGKTISVSFLKSMVSGMTFDSYQIDDLLAESETPEDYFAKTVQPKLLRILRELGEESV